MYSTPRPIKLGPSKAGPIASRRDFLLGSLAGAAGLALSTGAMGWIARENPDASARTPSGPPKRILVLGGTGFLGPAVVEAAKARGHTLTLFNRGKTEKRIGIIDGVEKLLGNRDPEKHADDEDASSAKGLSQLEEAIRKTPKGEKTWDAVVDTSGYVPRIVGASAKLLAPAASHYVFISTVSVYADSSTPDQAEDAPVATIADEGNEQYHIPHHYGPLKALCEQAAERHMPGRVTTIRPGFIVGPGDPTDRFTYWPVRISEGGTFLAPGTADDPTQWVDVRDLAQFIIRCIERGTFGTFNALGPPQAGSNDPPRFGTVVNASAAACVKLGKSPAKPEWVDVGFITAHGLQPGADLPIWIPPLAEVTGFHRRSNARAVAAGLTFRPLADTCADVLTWWPKEVERRNRVGKQLVEDATKSGKPIPSLGDPSVLRAGISRERETKVLEAWAKFEPKVPGGEQAKP